MKKLLATLISLLLIAVCVTGLVACGNGDDEGANAKFKYNITVWVGEDTKALTEQLITKFNKENDKSIWFTADVKEMTESAASGDVLAKPASAPEIFCFAQDQIARLVNSKLLAIPNGAIQQSIKDTHSDTAVKAATVGNTIYAYPLTEDNGYFLYYDTRVVSAEQAKTVEGIIAACESQNKYFSFNLGGGWYAASFYYATDENGNSLCKSEWTVDDQGRFVAHDDTFNSANGMIASRGMQKVLKSSRYLANGKASDFNSSIPAGAVVSGIWDYQTAKNALGENLGMAKLPTFEIDGKTYQLRSYLGSKLMGVTPQTDGNKAAALALLAQFLTNEQSQLARFEALGWGPSVKTAQNNEAVKANAALNFLKLTATVSQGQYPANWWSKAEALSNRIKAAADATATGSSTTALQSALDLYSGGLDSLLG